MQIAAAFGAAVVAIDVDPAKLEAIAAHGAALTLDAREHDAKALQGAVAGSPRSRGSGRTEWIDLRVLAAPPPAS